MIRKQRRKIKEMYAQIMSASEEGKRRRGSGESESQQSESSEVRRVYQISDVNDKSKHVAQW